MAAQPACVQSLLSVNAVPKQALLFQHNDADHEHTPAALLVLEHTRFASNGSSQQLKVKAFTALAQVSRPQILRMSQDSSLECIKLTLRSSCYRTLAAGRTEPADRLLISEAEVASSRLDTRRRALETELLILPAMDWPGSWLLTCIKQACQSLKHVL